MRERYERVLLKNVVAHSADMSPDPSDRTSKSYSALPDIAIVNQHGNKREVTTPIGYAVPKPYDEVSEDSDSGSKKLPFGASAIRRGKAPSEDS